MNIRVLLADDHALVRSGIHSLLKSMPGIQVVAEAADGAEALLLAGTHKPDLAILDIAMKGMNGVEAVRRFRAQQPDIKLLMLSMYSSEEYVMQALNAGANGYLLKDSAAYELEKAIRQVMQGQRYLDSILSPQALDEYMRRVLDKGTSAEVLTPRQRQILQLIAEGDNTKEIAYRLNVSGKTVETHRAQLMERLDIHDVPGLVRYAIRMGLTTAEK
ncbi:response regulator transcription factor [Undibacterium sp. CY18W]|uniref:Response regulator transcription factor n=1 Tax=Undibacterium hunanense TaxID=2762292 RepID=A0ABR6ZRF0_9BURK|nr:response regulator transcription factor [Undibacterium hunanense]MBC3918408.1 response regulator transcription factor [Undibacterium hunanense]